MKADNRSSPQLEIAVKRNALTIAVVGGALAIGVGVTFLSRDSPFAAGSACLCLAAVLILYATTRPGGSRAGALRLAASLLVVLGALDAEVAVLFFPRVVTDRPGQSFTVDDKLFGYAPRPGIRARVSLRRFGRTIVDARYTIDRHGFRATRASTDPAAPTVIFVGDSYTFGDGLGDADTLPQRYADITGQRVINAAFSGYGANQVLRLVQSDRLDPVIVGGGPRLFAFPVIDANLRRIDPQLAQHRVGTPHYDLIDGNLRFVGPFYPGLAGALVKLASRSAIVSGIGDLLVAAPSERGAELFGAMVQQASLTARSQFHARFLVVLWDEPIWQDGGDPRRALQRASAVAAMEREMQQRGVAWVRVSTLVPDYRAHMAAYVIPGSGHPSALLNRRLAGALAQRLVPPDR